MLSKISGLSLGRRRLQSSPCDLYILPELRTCGLTEKINDSYNNIRANSESYTRQYYEFLTCKINRHFAIQGNNKFCTASLILHLYFPCQFSKPHVYFILKTTFKSNQKVYSGFLSEKKWAQKTHLTYPDSNWLVSSFFALLVYFFNQVPWVSVWCRLRS